MAMKELSDCRILIVDDVPTNVEILVEALRADYKLSVAIDGERALRAVEKSPPDLILLDIMMPGIDGYEVCRRLRAAEATRDLPIMFLSALGDVENKARGFELGANDYLTKPFEILEVQARVRSLLKAKAYADAVREAMEREMSDRARDPDGDPAVRHLRFDGRHGPRHLRGHRSGQARRRGPVRGAARRRRHHGRGDR